MVVMLLVVVVVVVVVCVPCRMGSKFLWASYLPACIRYSFIGDVQGSEESSILVTCASLSAYLATRVDVYSMQGAFYMALSLSLLTSPTASRKQIIGIL